MRLVQGAMRQAKLPCRSMSSLAAARLRSTWCLVSDTRKPQDRIRGQCLPIRCLAASSLLLSSLRRPSSLGKLVPYLHPSRTSLCFLAYYDRLPWACMLPSVLLSIRTSSLPSIVSLSIS